MFDFLLENSQASFMGYGGSRGGAKSGAVRRCMVRRRMTYPGTSGQILRRVWDDVEKNHVNKMWEEFPELHQFYKSGSHVIELPNGSRIFFDAAETKIDVERKAYGPEYMDLFVDQAEQFSEDELVQLKTTCRWPGMDLHACKFGLFFNPGGPGAGYLQRVFSPQNKKYKPNENPADYVFLQAYGWDNVEWCRAALNADGISVDQFYSWDNDKRFEYYILRSQYGQEQNALPAHKRAGQLLGDFTKFAGQYFAFDKDVHVWAQSEVYVKPTWKRWISFDWGFGHHASAHWHALASYKDENGNDKRLIVTYKEMVKQGLSDRALAEEIVSVNDGDVISTIYAGHDCWRKDDRGTKEQRISQVLLASGLPKLRHAVIDRVDGWRAMATALDEGEWIITDNCVEAVAALPIAVFDQKKNNEDILKTDSVADDVLDDLRYGIYSPGAPAKKAASIEFQERAAHLTDPTSRAIFLSKLGAEAELKKSHIGQTNGRMRARANRYSGPRRFRRVA